MKNLILALFSIALISCSGIVENPDLDLSPSNKEEVSTLDKTNSIKEFENPFIIYGTTFGNYFQTLYKIGNFNEMLNFTSKSSIEKFGEDKILNFYRNMDFAYEIKLHSHNKNGDVTTLNYTAGIIATRKMVRIDVVVENDSTKIVLNNLNNFYQ
jgi:hypothetical protein